MRSVDARRRACSPTGNWRAVLTDHGRVVQGQEEQASGVELHARAVPRIHNVLGCGGRADGRRLFSQTSASGRTGANRILRSRLNGARGRRRGRGTGDAALRFGTCFGYGPRTTVPEDARGRTSDGCLCQCAVPATVRRRDGSRLITADADNGAGAAFGGSTRSRAPRPAASADVFDGRPGARRPFPGPSAGRPAVALRSGPFPPTRTKTPGRRADNAAPNATVRAPPSAVLCCHWSASVRTDS